MRKSKINYVIRDYTEEDFSNVHITDFYYNKNTLEYIASEIGESYYNGDPGDPDSFEAQIGLLFEGKEYWFNVTARRSLDFYSKGIPEFKKELK